MRLPLVHARLDRASESAGVSSGRLLRGPAKRVRVADDNADAAASLAMLVELQGHEVRLADDGWTRSIRRARSVPDIIFMELGMPRMDGIEAARRIRALPQGESNR